MPAALRASVALHVAGTGLAIAAPQQLPWVLLALLANHGVLTTAGLLPRCSWLGPNMSRLPRASAERSEVAITIDDGPDPEVTPAMLDLLDAHGARATFFCIADRARAHPALTRELVARGHSVQNHSASHRHNFSLLGPRGFRTELSKAQDILAQLAGRAPTLFRAPAGLRNPFLGPVLHDLGLTLVSWTRRGYDTRERDPAIVSTRLTSGLAAGDILLLHDGHAARTSAGRPVVLDVMPSLLARCVQQGLRTVTLPDALTMQPGRTLRSTPA
ncbi:hypothetical protein BH09PSE5_BH09PSE5_30570 [soil metagenome]